MDGSGTIDPAALNARASNASHYQPPPGSRGLKRSRSPDYFDPSFAPGDEDETKPRKRGRPPKGKGIDSPTMSIQPLTPATPNTASAPLNAFAAQASPTQTSPPRATPSSAAKGPVVKALPTVRDHTTDQLNPEGDEYIPRERDDAGERKVDPNGNLVDRTYRLRTFKVPQRGDKLFMLATECARVLNYRDSYLLFNKNRSLFKIIANQPEKDNLINQDVLPYSYRSRQIALVTARSMFRQFGSRVITDGRRVRDDYWEAKAIKQGFTEEDAAGEKRPGAAKQREAAAAEIQAAKPTLPHGQVIFRDSLGNDTLPQVPHGIDPVTFATLPVTTSSDIYMQSYPHIMRPRQEIAGSGYEDPTRESNLTEVATQATTAAEYNKQMTQQRSIRKTFFEDYWKRPHEAPPSPAQSNAGELPGTTMAHQIQSPQPNTMAAVSAPHQILNQAQPGVMMNSSAYGQNQSMMAQSPIRSMHQSLPPSQMQQSPGMGVPNLNGRQQTPSYNYTHGAGAGGGMWPPPQPQPSPHHMQAYGQQPQPHHAQQSLQSPMHPPAQLPRQGANMGYPQMAGANFNQMARNVYPQGSPGHQQYGAQQSQLQQQQQAGMPTNVPNWSQQQGGMGQDWQRGYQ